LNERTEDYNKFRAMYEEKRAECLRTQTEYKELEERYFNSKARSMEDVGRSLKVRCTRFCNLINNKLKTLLIILSSTWGFSILVSLTY